MKKAVCIILAATMIILMSACKKDEEAADIECAPDVSSKLKSDDLGTEWDEESAETITLKGSDVSTSSKSVTYTDGVITITEPGTYVVSGSLDDGQLAIDVGKENKAVIVLNDAEINCSDNACINVVTADKAIVILADGSENALSDGESYSLADGTDEPNAALFADCDLTIKGGGNLEIDGNFNNGITSKDDLKITGGSISVTAVNHGIKGKDSITAQDCSLTIDCDGDGMKTSNEEEKGEVCITSGSYKITAQGDGISCVSDLAISGGEFDITTGGGSANSSTSGKDWGAWGGGYSSPSDTDTETSAKAIKAANSINIGGGTFIIDSSDDSLHSNNILEIHGGELNISSGDDGMHSDTSLTIDGGNVDIAKSYEGIESYTILVVDGTIHVTSSDDGFNAAGGNDSSSLGGRPGAGNFAGGEAATGASLTFNGGYVYVNASGDGLDSNGSLVVNGGTVIVMGPTDDGNGALDAAGTVTVNGGTLVASGSSGMAVSPESSSSQNCVTIFTATLSANTAISVCDSSGNVIFAYKSPKTFSSVVISTPELKTGETYTVYSGVTLSGEGEDGIYSSADGGSSLGSFTQSSSSVTANLGGSSGMGGMGGMGGHTPGMR